MADFLQQELGVAMSGVKWDIGNFKLWQSTDPNIILFTVKQPVLAKDADGRYQFGVTQFRQQTDNTYKITGGTGIFTITSAVQFSDREFEQLKQQWLSEMRASEFGTRIPANPRFIPLNVRSAEATVLINPQSGEADPAHNEKDIGTPGGSNSFLMRLTELGAQEWVQGIKTKSIIPAGVKIMYEYLRMLPSIGATVKVHGRRVFTHLSTALKASVGNGWFGGSVQINAAWEKMVRNGDVEIVFIGSGLSPELEALRTELVTTFADQAREQMFKALFEPIPQVQEAQAGDTRGLFGGANFALKWKKVEDSTDLNLEIRFEGWTWLKASMDANLVSLISQLDDSYITEVNAQMSAPSGVLIDADPLLENVAVSWSASEGKAPEAPVFGSEGGNQQFIVTSQKINEVDIRWEAKVNFTPSSWPIIKTNGSQKLGSGGNQVVIKPSAWIGRHNIFMFVREGENILPPNDNDYLICNVSFEGPHLEHPIKASARMTPLTPLEFSYPLSPEGRRGTAKFSAFGVIGGKLVRSTEQAINFDEEAVFILVSSNDIKLVSQASVFGESLPATSLEKRLLNSPAKPKVKVLQAPAEITETILRPKKPSGEKELSPVSNNGHKTQEANGSTLKGTIVAVNYSKNNTSLVIETENGETKQVKLHDNEDANPFNDGRRRHVEISLAENGFAEAVAVIL
jgi:hypothetical protein